MYHSITFIDQNENEINTWDDLFLIPSSRPLVVPPDVEFNFIELPLAREPIDATQLRFGMRQGEWQFVVSQDNERILWKDLEPKKWIDLRDFTWRELSETRRHRANDDWVKRYIDSKENLPGNRVFVILEDDPEYLYEGRVWVSAWQTGASYSSVSFSYILEPYKYNISNPSIYSL